MSRVVITGKIPGQAVAALQAQHEVDAWTGSEPISRAECLSRIAGAEGILSLLTERVDGEFLDAAGPGLKIVGNVAVGYNNIDIDACRSRGVTVANTPRVLTEATADAAFALLLMVTRRFSEGERIIRSKTPWQWGMFFLLGAGIQGKTLGVIGMGQIGVAMARRARAFGMSVVFADESEVSALVVAELDANRVSLAVLLATSDVVSVHCPYLPSTHHLLGAEQFAAMKSTAFVVNSARGPIIDEEALVSALRAGQIAGAGLDVFEQEPTVHPGLLELQNVVLLPHLGSATVEVRTAMAMLAAQNVLNVLNGEPPLTPVT